MIKLHKKRSRRNNKNFRNGKPVKYCTISGCYTMIQQRGLCRKHYNCSAYNRLRRLTYRRTPSGYVRVTYASMRGRVRGTATRKRTAYIYLNLPICSKQEFVQWSLDNAQFHRLHRNWVLSNYNNKLSPSINRIDPRGGYTINNVEWLTMSQNCSLASVMKNRKKPIVSQIYAIMNVDKPEGTNEIDT